MSTTQGPPRSTTWSSGTRAGSAPRAGQTRRYPVFWIGSKPNSGKAERMWVMDRGIPTEEVLPRMRCAETPVRCLVGTPKGRLSKLEKAFLAKPWEQVREQVQVKLLDQGEELYVLALSQGRRNKERAMRRRRLKKLWRRLHELQHQTLTRDELLLKLGAAKKEAGRVYPLVAIDLPDPDQAGTPPRCSSVCWPPVGRTAPTPANG